MYLFGSAGELFGGAFSLSDVVGRDWFACVRGEIDAGALLGETHVGMDASE